MNDNDLLELEAMLVAGQQVQWWGENGYNRGAAMNALGLIHTRETWHDITCIAAAMWLGLERLGT